MNRKKLILMLALATTITLCACGQNDTAEMSQINVVDPTLIEEEVTDTTVVDLSEVVPEMLTNYEADGVIYYNGNPWDYNKVSPCNIVFGTVTSSMSGDNKVITVPIVLQMTGEYTDSCIDYSCCITPSFELCDINSGVIMPAQRGKGNSGYAYGGSIVNGDQTIAINYSCDYTCTKGGWESVGDGTFTRNITFNITYTIQVPQSYSGLVLKVTPVDSYSVGQEAASGESHFITDEYPAGTRVFSIN